MITQDTTTFENLLDEELPEKHAGKLLDPRTSVVVTLQQDNKPDTKVKEHKSPVLELTNQDLDLSLKKDYY